MTACRLLVLLLTLAICWSSLISIDTIEEELSHPTVKPAIRNYLVYLVDINDTEAFAADNGTIYDASNVTTS
jgi:hypothetical protein